MLACYDIAVQHNRHARLVLHFTHAQILRGRSVECQMCYSTARAGSLELAPLPKICADVTYLYFQLGHANGLYGFRTMSSIVFDAGA